jgi:peptidoglycan/xylan/chitin deacetylase (PgdA/CDA1 family)
VIFRGEVLEVRNVDAVLHIARKARYHDEWDPALWAGHRRNTFDDGPIPPYSNEILDILASQCVKVTYFMVGEMARAYPTVVRRVYEEGHTIGTHSEHHPTRFGQLPVDLQRFNATPQTAPQLSDQALCSM